jgi:hypothetical protein
VIISPSDVKARVVQSLRGRRPASHLLVAPPGTGGRMLLKEVWKAFRRVKSERDRIAHLSIDAITGEEELVTGLIREWVSRDPDLRDAWARERDSAHLDSPRLQLQAFGRLADDEDRRLFAFLQGFDRLFRYMPGHLLATMRDLSEDADSCLTFVNVSRHSYLELFERRRRETPDFVSEYGTTHLKKVIGPLGEKEAHGYWAEQVGGDEKSLQRAFAMAWEESGGLREFFEHLTRQFIDLGTPRDPRVYRRSFHEIMCGQAKKLLECDPGYDSSYRKKLAGIHLGRPGGHGRGPGVRPNAWEKVAVLDDEEEGPRLRVPALGVLAADGELDAAGDGETLERAAHLYREGRYGAADRLLRGVHAASPDLVEAVRLAMAVYGPRRTKSYHDGETDWANVIETANAAAAAVRPSDRQSYEGWSRIGRAMRRWPSDRAGHQKLVRTLADENDMERKEAPLLTLGVRLATVRRDPSPTSRLYAAIPVLEELVRFYVPLVLGMSPARLFEDLPRESVDAVWTLPQPFDSPAPGSRLTGLALAVGVCARAHHEGGDRQALFVDKGLARFGSLLDLSRNRPGHTIVLARLKDSEPLVKEGERLFDRLCSDGGFSLTLREVEGMMALPGL